MHHEPADVFCSSAGSPYEERYATCYYRVLCPAKVLSIDVNVVYYPCILPRQPIKQNETVAVTIPFSRSAVRRGNEHLPTPERLSARYAITKHCPPIRYLHNRIEMHLARLVLFYDIKVIVFSKKATAAILARKCKKCSPLTLR